MSKKESSSKQDNESSKPVQFQWFKSITGIILPIFALCLMVYEILLILKNIFVSHDGPINLQIFHDFTFTKFFCFRELHAKHIFHALILSTTSVALIGMHRAVHKLVPTGKDKAFSKRDLAFFFTLMANALLLAGLLIMYQKYFSKELGENMPSHYNNTWDINDSGE